MASTFNSQMLQNPSPDEDAYFKKEWFRWYDAAPKHLSKYGASDFADRPGVAEDAEGQLLVDQGIFAVRRQDFLDGKPECDQGTFEVLSCP